MRNRKQWLPFFLSFLLLKQPLTVQAALDMEEKKGCHCFFFIVLFYRCWGCWHPLFSRTRWKSILTSDSSSFSILTWLKGQWVLPVCALITAAYVIPVTSHSIRSEESRQILEGIWLVYYNGGFSAMFWVESWCGMKYMWKAFSEVAYRENLVKDSWGMCWLTGLPLNCIVTRETWPFSYTPRPRECIGHCRCFVTRVLLRFIFRVLLRMFPYACSGLIKCLIHRKMLLINHDKLREWCAYSLFFRTMSVLRYHIKGNFDILKS